MLFVPLMLLSLTASATPQGTRLLYEQRCLYCHSAEVAERKPRTPLQWKATVEVMRLKAPILITRTDARIITEYIVEQLKLVPPGVAPVMPPAPPPRRVKPPPVVAKVEPAPEPVPEPTPSPPVVVADPTPTPQPELAPWPAELDEVHLSPEDEEAEREGAQLMQQRCSKCHTLNRVFNKLDSFERSMATVRRMRMKTGSGITSSDIALIERFLRLDLEKADRRP